KEKQVLKESSKLFDAEFHKIGKERKIDIIGLEKLLELEIKLKPLCYRSWQQENTNGFDYISWFKTDKLGNTPPIISVTFLNDLNLRFCNSRYGIKYDITIDSFLGACEKDAATVIEDSSKTSLYTIGKTINDKLVNSYNLATPLITPIQVFDNSNNHYLSKHNEIILDSRYIVPKSVVYFDESDLDMVTLISKTYSIQIEKILISSKKTSYQKRLE
ncbi:MAG: hypothetical protein RSA10_03700, partial [Bacilli bacterium]